MNRTSPPWNTPITGDPCSMIASAAGSGEPLTSRYSRAMACGTTVRWSSRMPARSSVLATVSTTCRGAAAASISSGRTSPIAPELRRSGSPFFEDSGAGFPVRRSMFPPTAKPTSGSSMSG